MTAKPTPHTMRHLSAGIVFTLAVPILAIVSTLASLHPAQATEPHRATPVLSVSGTGTVNAEPDIAYISSGVVSEAKTAQKALAQNNAKMEAIFNVLAKAGIERKHIQTSNFSVQPRYTHHRPKKGEDQKPPKITGYTVNNTVTVKVTDLSKLGQTITEVVEFGSNQLSNIHFDISNKQDLLDQARSAAVLDARRKADIYTSAAGVKIGRLVSLSEGTRHLNRPQRQSHVRTARLEAAATPVSGAEQQLSFTVAITWEIEQ